jgi:SAM-dependent methyltransferase
MKKNFIEKLRCIECARSKWDLQASEENTIELRRGILTCQHCLKRYVIENGVLNALAEALPEEVLHEKKHAETFDYLVTESGEKHPINLETARKFSRLFLSLPAGDGSSLFRPGGSFDNQAGNAERFFKTLDLLNLTGRESVLEVGASFGWASWRFAQRGCKVTALDVTRYLEVADLYMEKDGVYYERVMADMSKTPFCDQSFDLIFSHSVIHHCKELKTLFSEFKRLLKPGGRVVALHECAFGIFEDKAGKALQHAIEEGFNENAYTLPQWKKGALDAGFKNVDFHFFSFIDDYIYRKTLRNSPATAKLKWAKAIQKRPAIHKTINQMSVWPRILLRPKSWLMAAEKSK